MYDPRSEPHEFIGGSRSEAVAKACSFYDADEDALVVAEFGSDEVFGLAARVVVVAVPRDLVRGRRGPERGGRDRDRAAPERPVGREARGRGAGPRARPAPRPREQPRPEPPAEKASEGRALTDLSPEGQFVLGLVEHMDIGPFEISESLEEGLRALVLKGDGARRLVEGEGRAVEAVQLLANQAALRLGGEDAHRVVVDAEGDSDQREELLERLAERAASRAERSGRTISLDPMNPRDRRAVHVALRDYDGVATLSRGSGRYRRVLVVPEGAPEYEEARSSAAASQDES